MLQNQCRAAGKVETELMQAATIGDLIQRQVLLAANKPAVAAVLRGVRVEDHFVLSWCCVKTIIRVGAIRMKVEGKQEPGSFKNKQLVV